MGRSRSWRTWANILVENRSGLIAAAMATQADGMAERDAGLLLAQRLKKTKRRRRTLGADKGYDSRDFVCTVRELDFTPHVNQNQTYRRSAIDARTTRHAGYGVSLSKRWLVEKPFGWMKSKHTVKALVDWGGVIRQAR